MPSSIFLLDDHPLVLSGIGELLRGGGYAVTAAKGLAEAAMGLAAGAFDLMLLDLNLAEQSGLAVFEDGLALPQKVVMLSGVTEQEWILKGFELGAFGFIPKTIEPDGLLAAVAAMLAAAKPSPCGWVWDAGKGCLTAAHDYFPKETTLTPKERAVFMLMREGKLDKQIADDLGLSIHTVRVHIRAIKRKRGHNRRFEQLF